MERSYSINQSVSSESIDLDDPINPFNPSNKTKLLNSENATKIKTGCCVYLCELICGLACCLK